MVDESPGCLNQDFQFRIHGKYYKNGFKKLSICPSADPLVVEVHDMNASPPAVVPGNGFIWRMNGVVDNRSTTSMIVLNAGDIAVLNTLECSWTDGDVILRKINKKSEGIKFLPGVNPQYSYDPNSYLAYVKEYGGKPDHVNVPWVFIGGGDQEFVEAKFQGKTKRIVPKAQIKTNSAGLVADPTPLTQVSTQVKLDHQNSGHHVYEVAACDYKHPDLRVFTEEPKSHYLEFFRLCDTDDDIANYCENNREYEKGCTTKIMSPDFKCIDGSTDLHVDQPGGVSNFLKGQDILWRDPNNMVQYVLAGPNLKCDSDVHAPGSSSQCAGQIPSVQDMLDFTNEVYNTVNFNFTLSNIVLIRDLRMNWDYNNEDSELSQPEANAIHDIRFQNGLIGNKELEILFWDNTLKGDPDIKGFALPGGKKLVVIKVPLSNNYTLPHEIGHALFKFEHPKDHPGVSGDTDNLMYFNSVGRAEPPLLRRYQWGVIHDK